MKGGFLMGWEWKKRCKARRKRQHEMDYVNPMCHLCEDCYTGKSNKHEGNTKYCAITGNDVGQSHFGLNSPRNCPKRSFIDNSQQKEK